MALIQPADQITPRTQAHSRRVAVLKVVLPLLALILLSLVFLLARTVDPSQGVRTAPIDVEDRARDPRLTGARFAGVTEDGAALTITAETARSDPGGALRMEVSGLSLSITAPDGLAVSAHAAHGLIDRGAGLFRMSGGIVLETSHGYRLEGAALQGTLDSTLIEAPDAVSGTAPAGRIEAGGLLLRPAEGAAGGYVLVFQGGVRLNYLPVE